MTTDTPMASPAASDAFEFMRTLIDAVDRGDTAAFGRLLAEMKRRIRVVDGEAAG